jgi:hypothetical protein
MTEMVGACGLICSECTAYVATQSGDPQALEQVAASWRTEYSNPSITPEGVVCDGCMAESERRCFHCAECDIRACCVERGLASCGECQEYACDKVNGLLEMVPAARQVLDRIHGQVARG